MNGSQFDYCVKAKNLPWYNKSASKEERATFQTWLSQQTDLKQDPESKKTHIELFWSTICLFGSNGSHLPITVDNLNALKNSAQLRPLLEWVPAPQPISIPTPAQRQQAEAELAGLEKSWRPHYEFTTTLAGIKREIVAYNTVENLDAMVKAICDPQSPAFAYGVCTGESLLLAFKHLNAMGQLNQDRRPDRPTHDKPATRESVREAQEKSEREHAQKRQDIREVERLHADVMSDAEAIVSQRGNVNPTSGKIDHSSTYAVQNYGLELFHKKYDATFERIGGEELETYKKIVANIEKEIAKRNPSSGGILSGGTRVNTDSAKVFKGADFCDVMTQMPSTATGEKRRDSLGPALSTNVKIPYGRR
jgi:hypothetical protein